MTTKSDQRDVAFADLHILAVNEDARTVEYVMSDDSVDSYGEIVDQSWRLDRFKKNPVVLYGHNRANGFLGSLKQEETLPIGRVVKGPERKGNKKEGYRLVGTVEFAAEEINPFAERVFRLVKGGFLRGGSVGFYPHDVRREKHDGEERYVLADNELFEFSITPLQANANAVANEMQDREKRRAYLAKRAEECAQRGLFDDTQPAASGQENTEMTEAEFKAKLAELEAANKKLADDRERSQAELEASTKSIADLRSEVDALKAERDAAVERATMAEDEAIEAELGALVGVKFHAAELDDVREDRKRLGKEAFAQRMERRPDLKTAKAKIADEAVETKNAEKPAPKRKGSALSAHVRSQA